MSVSDYYLTQKTGAFGTSGAFLKWGMAMQRIAPQVITASADIDDALRRDVVSRGEVLPMVPLVSDEHGPLVVMRAKDLAAVMAHMRRPRAECLSTS